MATRGSELMSDEIVNVKCCVCAEEKRTREAEKYCVNCKDYYCSSCVGIHQTVHMMKGHTVLNKEDFGTLGPDGSLPGIPTQRCSQHNAEIVNMYCEDQDAVACGSCIALNHRFCKKVISITENIDNLYKYVNFNDLELQLRNTKKSMEAIKKAKETELQELTGVLNQNIESVRAFRQELQDMIEVMEQNTLQELRREFDTVESSITRDIDEINSLFMSLNEALFQLKKAEGNLAQEFVCVKSSKQLAARGELIEKSQQMATDETISFNPDKNIKTFLQQKIALGKVSFDKLDIKVSKCTLVDQTYIPKDELYRVKQQREVNVKLWNDKNTCGIWGSCIADGSFLLLADNWNHRLKCMDMSTNKIKTYTDLAAGPHAVCTVSKSEAVVTLNNQSVQFVSLGEKMYVTRTLTMKHTCHGLAYKDGRLFISDNTKTVYIYDMNGQKQKRIMTDASGINIFQCTQHIVASPSRDMVFVADTYKGVIILDNLGNYLSTLSDNNVSSCEGVATDGRNVFVSGHSSNNIAQFGHDYKMVGEIGKVGRPLSVCYYHNKKWLVITSYKEDKITILELE